MPKIPTSLKYIKRHMFGAVNVCKKIANHTILLYITSRQPVRSAYQPPASSTFLSEQISQQQSASSTFLSEQISTSHQPNEQAANLLIIITPS
jgi:hypothetical protein